MAAEEEVSPQVKAGRQRVDSIDLLRGLVMVIMALDHVRDYFHADAQLFSPDDLTRTNALLFFTRWITHFCAPVFMFLAGVSVHFFAPRRGSRAVVSRFLITRGLWLIVLDATAVNVAESFNFSFRFTLLQVLWAMGWSMIALAGLIWLPRRAVLGIALAMIGLHNLFDGVAVESAGMAGWLWKLLHVPTMVRNGDAMILFLYPLVPWIGVMAAGYCFGPVMQMEPAQRRRMLWRMGGAATAAFFVIRAVNVYGDARHWAVQGSVAMTAASFFNVTKYPPSLLYLLMTLGPAMLMLAALDSVRVGPENFFRVFGRVPMFYYLAHFYALHAAAVVVGGFYYGKWGFLFQFPAAGLGIPTPDFPKDYGYSLGVVYAVWLVLVVALYFPCRWYMNFKNRNHAAWLSYL